MRLEQHVIVSDMHAPFHDIPLILKVCRFIKDIQPKGFILNGDGVDLYSLGRFNADSVEKLRSITLADEYRAANSMLDAFDAVLPAGCVKHYLYGNHEDRYFRELERGDRGKYGSALVSPTVALRLTERGYATHENYRQDFVLLGSHLEVTHGIYCGVHPAKKHLDEFQGSVIVGHTHRFQTHNVGKRAAWNFGYLGDTTSPGFHYEPRTVRDKWTQSFGVVSVAGNGDFWVEPIQVHNGIFIYAGKVY
jgi:predicted phosphodiesterase